MGIPSAASGPITPESSMSRKMPAGLPTPAGMPRVEVPNVQVAGDARQFRETAEFLFANIARHGCVLPLLMVASFALELYLKALNSENVYHSLGEELGLLDGVGFRVTANPLKWGHSLVGQFDEIDPKVRRGLERAYAASPALHDVASIREALARYEGLFENSRYPHQDGRSIGKESIDGLVRLVMLVGKYIDNLPRREIDR